MEGSSLDYSTIIGEIDLVIVQLKEKGLKEDIDENVIFTKLERKAKEKNRVAKVVDEIISEKAAKDMEVIVIDEDETTSPDVEILLDLKDNFTSPHNQFGNVADKARKIFEHDQGVKRRGDEMIDECSQEEKRSRESDVFDLFKDAILIDEIEAFGEVVVSTTMDSDESENEKEFVTSESQKNLSYKQKKSKSERCLEASDKKKLTNTSIASAGTNSSSSQGAVDFLYNNIDPGSDPYLKVNGNNNKAECTKTSSPASDSQRKPMKIPSCEVSPQSSKKSSAETENRPNDTEVEVLSLTSPKSGNSSADKYEKRGSPSEVNRPTSLEHQELETEGEGKTNKSPSQKGVASHKKRSMRSFRIFNEKKKKKKKKKSGASRQVPSCSKLYHIKERPYEFDFDSSDELEGENEHPVAGTSGKNGDLGITMRDAISMYHNSMKLGKVLPSVQLKEEESTCKEELNRNEAEKSRLFEEQLQYLIGVLPDADPAFLEGLVRDCEGNDERLKDFVVNALDNDGGKPIYPTRGESQQRKEQEDLIKRFTDNFSVEDFLQVFPDPTGYFENETREIENYREHSLAYLRCKFRHLYMCNIMSALKKRNYNLTLTVLDLAKFDGLKRKSKRSAGDCKWPSKQSIAFLQEVAYLENKEKILKFQAEKKAKREKAFEEAKANNQLLTCGCCFDDEFLMEDMSSCSEGHLFCKDCIKRGVEVIIGDGNSHFPCMSAECKAEFSLSTLQGILTPSVFGKLVQRLQMEEIYAAGIEGLETCPSCPYSTIPAPDDRIFKCLNPDCLRETCRNCKEQSHIPLRCEEVEKNSQVKARTYIEDKMTEAIVRTCWKCGKKFIKESGCNKMTCTCGAMMCYLCRKPVNGYKHFNPELHRESDLCPLYSNDGLLDFDAVKAVAERAKEEVLQQNPDMKLIHDPTLKLPEVPPNNNNNFHNFPIPDGLDVELIEMRPGQYRLIERVHENDRRVAHINPPVPGPLGGDNPENPAQHLGGFINEMMPMIFEHVQRFDNGQVRIFYHHNHLLNDQD